MISRACRSVCARRPSCPWCGWRIGDRCYGEHDEDEEARELFLIDDVGVLDVEAARLGVAEQALDARTVFDSLCVPASAMHDHM